MQAKIDIRAAYNDWSLAKPGQRRKEWHAYCDIRDGLEPGTTAQREREQFIETQNLNGIIRRTTEVMQ